MKWEIRKEESQGQGPQDPAKFHWERKGVKRCQGHNIELTSITGEISEMGTVVQPGANSGPMTEKGVQTGL